MDIRITGKHTEITQAIRDKIQEKVSRLPKFYSSIIDAEVIIEGSKGEIAGSVEIIVHAKHNRTFVARQVGQDVDKCLEEVIKKIESQIKKQKQKERDNKHSDKSAKKLKI